jgi:hypothetical protein
MADLLTIRQSVSVKLQDRENNSPQTTAALVDAEINRSIRYYQNYRFWFNERKVDITLTASAQTVPSIPSDVISELEVNGLLLIDQQVKIDLQKLPPDEFFKMDDGQTGRPEFYTYVDGEYKLLPIPSEAYTLQFRYLKKYDALVTDSDSNDFTANAEDLIMLHTLKSMYAENKQDPQLAGYYNSLELRELEALRERSDNRLSTGILQSYSILQNRYI